MDNLVKNVTQILPETNLTAARYISGTGIGEITRIDWEELEQTNLGTTAPLSTAECWVRTLKVPDTVTNPKLLINDNYVIKSFKMYPFGWWITTTARAHCQSPDHWGKLHPNATHVFKKCMMAYLP